MAGGALSNAEKKRLKDIVSYYVANQRLVAVFQDQLLTTLKDEQLVKLIHTVKARLKDPSHLLDKLERKALKAKESGIDFDITPETLFLRINDLAGIRILHLHTS